MRGLVIMMLTSEMIIYLSHSIMKKIIRLKRHFNTVNFVTYNVENNLRRAFRLQHCSDECKNMKN